MPNFKYYINEEEYTPENEGDLGFSYNLKEESGSNHFVIDLVGSLIFEGAAFQYIMAHEECQEIKLHIEEITIHGTFVFYNGTFTKRFGKIDPAVNRITVEVKSNGLYTKIIEKYTKKFNFLAPGIEAVQSEYLENFSDIEYLLRRVGVSNFEFPFWGDPSASQPFIGGAITADLERFLFVRDKKATYCNSNTPVPPQGADWELYLDLCDGKQISIYTRGNPTFVATATIVGVITQCAVLGCTPINPADDPAIHLLYPDGEWVKIGEVVITSPTYKRAFYWLNWDTVPKTVITLNNGRKYVDALNYGLNLINERLDLQSQFLFNDVNPVTGKTPSSTQDLQIHAIGDVKAPSATEPATREDITVKDLLGDIADAKLNCFWRVDERTGRVIIENRKDLLSGNIIDVSEYEDKYKEYDYDNTDIPNNEAFPSLDSGIDFTGVDIVYNNGCSKDEKTYNTDKVYTEVEAILQDPDIYPNDGFVLITPDSLAFPDNISPSGERAERGIITGNYSANAPMAMANLHDKFFKYKRPFKTGVMNFEPTEFENHKPVKKAAEIVMPLCSLFLFDPYSKFVGQTFTEGQLFGATYSNKTGMITLNIQYNE